MRFISVKIRCRFSKQLKTESLARQIDKRGFIKNGGYLLSHCYAVPSA